MKVVRLVLLITRLKRGVQMSVVVVSDMIQSEEKAGVKTLLVTLYDYYQQKLSEENDK